MPEFARSLALGPLSGAWPKQLRQLSAQRGASENSIKEERLGPLGRSGERARNMSSVLRDRARG